MSESAGEDYCASSPCSNGASCYNLVSGFVCKCLEGFHGVTCQLQEPNPDVPTVEPQRLACPTTAGPCPEITTPDVTTAAPVTCPPPGPEVDYCADQPCDNGGTCYNVTRDYLCVCPRNVGGRNCTEGIESSSVHCLTGCIYDSA